jgi:hypothetical protein
VSLAAPAAAAADFEPITQPPGTAVAAFGASGDTWVAMMDSFGGEVQLSLDSGATWSPTDVGISIINGPSIAPDRALWFGGSTNSHKRALARIAPDGAVSQLVLDTPVGIVSPPAFDPQGRMWVAVASDADEKMYVIRLNPDGSQAERVESGLHRGDLVWMRFVGSDGWVSTATETYRLRAGKLVKLAGSSADDVEWVGYRLWPVSVMGKTVFNYWSMSVDGGKLYSQTLRPQLAVQGRPDLLLRWPVNAQPRAPLLSRCASFVFCETGLAVPPGTGAIWQTKRGLLAVSAPELGGPTGPLFRQAPVFALHSGPLPPAPTSGGGAPRGSKKLVAEMNRYRKEAGMPPLLYDAAMSRAALRHAKYLEIHGGKPNDPSSYHVEVKGRKGFSGVTNFNRCAAEGGSCDTEEVLGGASPIRSMIATYYHRLYPMNAFTRFAGAARFGHWTVIDLDAGRSNLTTRQHGYPNGTYSGPLRYQHEIPDPLEFCPRAFDPGFVGTPPVTFVPPGMEPSRPRNLTPEIRFGPDVTVHDVRLYQGKRRLPGCENRVGGAFIGDKPLRRHTRYTAKARWRPTPKSPMQTYTWSFRTR